MEGKKKGVKRERGTERGGREEGRDERRKEAMTYLRPEEENKIQKKSRKGADIFKNHLHSCILSIKNSYSSYKIN